jgi:hypothetical protein
MADDKCDGDVDGVYVLAQLSPCPCALQSRWMVFGLYRPLAMVEVSSPWCSDIIFVVCLLPGGRYLVQRVIPMLPRLLCEQLCSLQPGDPRFAFSIVWEMDEDGHIYRFGSYAHVLSMGAVRGLPPHLLHATPTILSCSRRSNKQCLCMVTSLKRQ